VVVDIKSVLPDHCSSSVAATSLTVPDPGSLGSPGVVRVKDLIYVKFDEA
jgi:hypothetical protein